MASKTEIVMAAAVLAVLACGGASKRSETMPDDDDGETEVEGDVDDGMVAPERMDEIKSELDRKRSIVARCLTEAIDAKQAPRNARGRVTVEFVISPAGKAQNIKVVESSLESQMVQDCVMGHVRNIEFGALPKPLDWSYTYNFEAY